MFAPLCKTKALSCGRQSLMYAEACNCAMFNMFASVCSASGLKNKNCGFGCVAKSMLYARFIVSALNENVFPARL
jgi:hypothetical protein